MNKCKKCGNFLSSNGYCHQCLCYDVSASSNAGFQQFCKICDRYFIDFDKYSAHLQSHPICEYCKERFISKTELQTHLKSHECSLCHSYFHPISKHMMQHSFCNLCKKWFYDKEEYNDHLIEHPQCEHCENRFNLETDLQLHRETHKCPVCYSYFHPISEHMKQHSYCNLCTKWFLGEKEYNEHLIAHPQCEYCKTLFSTHIHLRNHMDSTHKCRFCHRYFEDIRLHMREEHPYCPTCKKYYSNMDRYMEKHPKCKYCSERVEVNSLSFHIFNSHYCPLCNDFFYPLYKHLKSNHFYSDKLKAWYLSEEVLSEFENDYLKLLKCKVCGKQLYSVEGLTSHSHAKHNAPSEFKWNSSVLEYLLKGQVYLKKQQDMLSFFDTDLINIKLCLYIKASSQIE